MKSDSNPDRWKNEPGDLIITTPDGKTIRLGEKPKAKPDPKDTKSKEK